MHSIAITLWIKYHSVWKKGFDNGEIQNMPVFTWYVIIVHPETIIE